MRPAAGLLVLTSMLATLLLGAVLPAAAAPGSFVPLASPSRVLDSRPGGATYDSRYQGVGAVAAGATLTLPVAGRVGVPSGAGAIALTVTVVSPTSAGFLTAYPCGVARPATSSLNFGKGQVTANTVIARPGVGGAVCLFTSSATQLLVDVTGWFPTEAVTPLAGPVRLLDTRVGGATVDGLQVGRGALAAGGEIALPVAGRGGLPSTPSSVVLNLTVVAARQAGYLSVFPCASGRPNSSSINYVAGMTRANAVVVGVPADGHLCIYGSGQADVILDASGTLPAGAFTPVTPGRLLDTRAQPTVDGQYSGTGRQPAGASLTLPVAGRGGVPGDARAVVLNVTAVLPSASGFTTVFPQGAMPNASSLNFSAGQVVANLVVAPLSATGSACLTTMGATTDLVVDVTGYLTTDVAPGSSPCPSYAVSTAPDTVRNQLVYRAPLQRAVGTDKVGVVVCSVPDGYRGYDPTYARVPSTVDVSPATVASWANANVTQYYRDVSGGKYVPTFVALGTASLSPANASAAGGPDDCLAQAAAMARDSTFTNVLATDNRLVDYGFASPGGIPDAATVNPTVLTSGPPSASHRGLYLGGDVVFTHPNWMIAVHEVGHTIHWPHSYLSGDEYDNPTDVMSGSPGAPGAGWCSTGDGTAYACKPQSALAFDRMTAGWMTSPQSVVHAGVVNYALDAATSTSANSGGTQLVAVPDPRDRWSSLTIEGRAAVGYDALLAGPYCHVVPDPQDPSSGVCDAVMPSGHDGVVVSLVRQTESSAGVSLNRRQSQATGRAYSFDHVLQVGDSVTIDGVHIAVLARTGNVFTVQVRGTYTTPASMKALVPRSAPGLARAVVPGSSVVPVSAPERARVVAGPR